ncbi:MAG: hypothetical protein KY476_26460 [Planctomycetes bacterium]|nr:hypothetical protein [Planctomycetota bacterium]
MPTSLAAALFLAAFTPAAEQAIAPEELKGLPLDFGHVIVEGRYLPAPHVVSTRGKQVLIDGVAIDSTKFSIRGRHPETAPSDEGMRPEFELQARIERLMADDGLVIVFHDGTVGLIHSGDAWTVMEILVDDLTPEAKLQSLLVDGPTRFTSNQWFSLIESFQTTPQLQEEFGLVAGAPATAPAGVLSEGILYVLTVIGMLLIAASLAVILSHRPELGRWSEQDLSGESLRFAGRCAVLIGLLSVFDLACTCLAETTGNFWEMNPLGQMLIDHPLALGGFKLVFTLGGLALLLRLRRYRGTQTAFWCLCLVLTLVTLRWITFNSLLLA